MSGSTKLLIFVSLLFLNSIRSGLQIKVQARSHHFLALPVFNVLLTYLTDFTRGAFKGFSSSVVLVSEAAKVTIRNKLILH